MSDRRGEVSAALHEVRQRIAAAVITGSAAVLGMTGCGQVPPTGASTIAVPASPSASPSEPSPSTSESASSPPATPTTPTTPTPSLSATAGPQVKATGTLKLFAVASKKLAGTCVETGGVPVLKLADHKNDFFNTVDVALVLNPARKTVSSGPWSSFMSANSDSCAVEYAFQDVASQTSTRFMAPTTTHSLSSAA